MMRWRTRELPYHMMLFFVRDERLFDGQWNYIPILNVFRFVTHPNLFVTTITTLLLYYALLLHPSQTTQKHLKKTSSIFSNP